MAEVVAQSQVTNCAAAGAIDLVRGDTWSGRSDCGPQSGASRLVHALDLVRGFADRERHESAPRYSDG